MSMTFDRVKKLAERIHEEAPWARGEDGPVTSGVAVVEVIKPRGLGEFGWALRCESLRGSWLITEEREFDEYIAALKTELERNDAEQ
jgi:hypothetical protein